MVIRIPDNGSVAAPVTEGTGVVAFPGDNVDPVKAEFENRRAVMRRVCARTRHLGEAVAELQALDDQFADDTDFDSVLPRYREQVDAIRQRRIEAIGDEGVAKVFDKEFDFIAEARRIAFDGNTHKREVAHERQTLNDSLDRFAFAAANANSPLERQMMLDAAGTSIREAATVGYITPQDAELLTAGFQDNLVRRELPPEEEVLFADVDTVPDAATDTIPILPMEGLIRKGRAENNDRSEETAKSVHQEAKEAEAFAAACKEKLSPEDARRQMQREVAEAGLLVGQSPDVVPDPEPLPPEDIPPEGSEGAARAETRRGLAPLLKQFDISSEFSDVDAPMLMLVLAGLHNWDELNSKQRRDLTKTIEGWFTSREQQPLRRELVSMKNQFVHERKKHFKHMSVGELCRERAFAGSVAHGLNFLTGVNSGLFGLEVVAKAIGRASVPIELTIIAMSELNAIRAQKIQNELDRRGATCPLRSQDDSAW